MYTYTEIKELHVELSSNCQASCPMCARNHHGGIENPKIKISNLSTDDFKKIIIPSLSKQLEHIIFSGNFGDPSMNDDLPQISEYLKSHNSNIQIDLHTNGSLRNIAWWERLATILPKNSVVHFAIDGLADTHSLYRIGTDYNKIIKNAQAFINKGGNARWVFIKFKHNEHQIEEAKRISKELGFNSFQEKQSARFIGQPYFDVYDKEGNVTHRLESPTEQNLIFIDRKTVENYKEIFKTATIECAVKKNKSIYLDSLGYIWPCCFVGQVPYINTYPNQLVHNFQTNSYTAFNNLIERFGGIKNFNCNNKTISEIVDSFEWQTIWDETFVSNPLPACTRACGKFNTPTVNHSKDQFIELQNF